MSKKEGLWAEYLGMLITALVGVAAVAIMVLTLLAFAIVFPALWVGPFALVLLILAPKVGWVLAILVASFIAPLGWMLLKRYTSWLRSGVKPPEKPDGSHTSKGLFEKAEGFLDRHFPWVGSWMEEHS